jgi:hypothetical protein
VENVPAFHEEPMMPGEATVRPWMLLAYRDAGKLPEPEKYWNSAGKEMYNEFLKQALKPNDEIRRAAASAVNGASNDEQKVEALIRYVRKNVRNLFSSEVTEADRTKILKESEKGIRSAAEVMKTGIGTPSEMNTLFASMASAVGLETRPAWVADRLDIVFNPGLADRYFLPNVDMAVNINNKWTLHDVSSRLLPANMISWREEGMQALLSDPKTPMFISAPLSAPEASTSARTAKFTLSEDGGVEGDVDEQFSGHRALDHRYEMQNISAERRLENLKEREVKLFPDAEVSDLKIENADDPEQPLKLHFHIKIAGYAQRTGKRILIQPLFFQRGVPPLFSATDRKYPVDLRYAWRDQDTVSFVLPNGYELDHAESPGSLNFGAPGSYTLKLVVKDHRELVATRELVFGKGGSLAFPVDLYPKVKNVFDAIHQHDEVTLALKQPAAGTQ